ncbi:MAG: hypothetical protein CMP10_01350 [Zetaproteobacteria bacterium]|nr:hypothetical protein [Pseudobdellovibrionaceae bacterium]
MRSSTRRLSANRQHDSGGSVWTSLSDLFTSLAVIFLVMFVVVAIKHNIAQFQSVDMTKKYKDFIAGKVSDEQIKKAKRHENQLESSLQQMHSMKKTIMDRSAEIKMFAMQIDSHRSMMEKILKDREIKSAAYQAMEDKVASSVERVSAANQEVKVMAKTVENKVKVIERRDTEIAELNQKLLELRKTIETRDQKVENLMAQVAKKSQDVVSEQQVNQSLTQEINDFDKVLAGRDGEINQLNKGISERDGRIQGLKSEIDNQSMKVASGLAANGKLKNELDQLGAALGGKDKEIGKLKNQAYHKEIRKKIADNMASRFKQLGIDVELDRKTGKIFLRSDQNYLFANDSFALEEAMQEKLRKLIPVYADELLGDPKISPLITEISVVGHASPRFEGRPLDPVTAEGRAYKFNLRLSINRANAVANYIFGSESVSFNKKLEFRRLLTVSGMSFSNPIASDNVEVNNNSADNENGLCGAYDCEQSRRVEVSFGLREDISGMKDFLVH